MVITGQQVKEEFKKMKNILKVCELA